MMGSGGISFVGGRDDGEFITIMLVGDRAFFPTFAIPTTLPLLSKLKGMIKADNAFTFWADEGMDIRTLKLIWARPCTVHPCGDKSIVTTFDRGNEDAYHWYEIKSKPVCSELTNKACTLDKAFKVMLAHPDTVAPVTSNREVIRDCGVVSLQTLAFRAVNYDNVIRTAVNMAAHSVTNYTLPSHMFYPGFVVRKLVEENHSIVVDTIGTGSGSFRDLNVEGAKTVIWPEADEKLRQ